MLDRRHFLSYFSGTGLATTLFPGALYTVHQESLPGDNDPLSAISEDEVKVDDSITLDMIEKAEKIAGLVFTPEQRALMLEDLQEALQDFIAMREESIPNSVAPSLQFDLRASGALLPTGTISRLSTGWEPPTVELPSSEEDIAFMSVAQLSGLIKSRQISVTRLTSLYLARLKRFDAKLQAVVTLTEERAMAQAAQLDEELRQGQWRGPLHGIPWGAKDLLAVKGYPTTWGAVPYREQVIDEDATVVQRLDNAGAVLVAKLTLGALAWGDVWFGGTTKNPWNIEEGSSGSSAGPGSAVAAGLVAFAIGSETLGSIVSPSTRNGVTGHRPTYGRVGRGGAMALSWSMDKLGPMCRSAEDCALVFDAIHGNDGVDVSSMDVPFEWQVISDPLAMRIGYIEEAFEGEYPGDAADKQTLDVLRAMGMDLIPVSLPDRAVGPMLQTLSVEAAAAFDEITRNGQVDSMVRQVRNAWPNVFRAARFVPAVEYIQANRLRTLLMQEMETVMQAIDVFVSPSFRGSTLRITNLTGHPAVVVPNRFDPLSSDQASPRRSPGSITFVGGLFKDREVLAVAHAYQQQTDFHLRRPPIG